MKNFKLKNQSELVVRVFILLGILLGGIFAFIFSPIGGTNAQSIDCPEGQYLATGNVCITNDKDIVLQVMATEENQTLKINKYFANAYSVDRGDGTTGDLTSDITHTYSASGTYIVILSLSGADRWIFQNLSKSLVPVNGTSMTGVKIVYMPNLAEGFGDSATAPGHYFFQSFNRQGAIISLPEGSFDTSNIITPGNNFFDAFNYIGLLENLPIGSFNISNISGVVGNLFFGYFNYNGQIISLPEGSFDTSNITKVGNDFFRSFNYQGNLTSLPEGSFDTSNINMVGNYFFAWFNNKGKLISLPSGSFNISKVNTVGGYFFSSFNNEGKLTSLPEGSFNTSNISGTVGNYFFNSFNSKGKLTSLPEGSFNISNITSVGDNFFTSFNYYGEITSLPEGSFNTSNVSGEVGKYFFDSFNYGGKLAILPENSFDVSNIITVGDCFFFAFNTIGKLTSLPDGSFNISNITTVGKSGFAYFNTQGLLTRLPEGSFRFSTGLTTVGDDFFYEFNTRGELINLPGGSFNTDNITTVGNDFFQYFNYDGKLTSLPDGSFDTSNVTTAGDYFFSYFNYDGRLTKLPDSFHISSVGISATDGYVGAFDSTYTLNKNVSDLVLGLNAPLVDIDTFSDNQPGRCGVDANWLVNPATSCEIVTVRFYTDEGVLLEIITGYNGDIVTTPEISIKTGYTMKGRYETGSSDAFDFSVAVTGSVDVYAKWDANKYTITFVDGDGEIESYVWTGEYLQSVTIDYPIWTRIGYALSWDKEIPATVPAENVVITANWSKNQAVINGGGGGGRLKRDKCPGGDYSDSYYDGICEGSQKEIVVEDDHLSADEFVYDVSAFNLRYSDEMNQAYQYAYHYGVTTKSNIEEANMDGVLNRIAMAKMLSQYAINVLGRQPDKTRQNTFVDVSSKLDSDYDNGVSLAYQLGIMGINMPNNKFRPYDLVTRAEFVTALSRLKYGIEDGKDVYYSTHMNLLHYLGIIKKTNPKMIEKRGYVMLMLMRSAND